MAQTLQQRIPMAELTFQYVPAIQRAENGKRRYFVDALTMHGEPIRGTWPGRG
jgi:hypothetical protein